MVGVHLAVGIHHQRLTRGMTNGPSVPLSEVETDSWIGISMLIGGKMIGPWASLTLVLSNGTTVVDGTIVKLGHVPFGRVKVMLPKTPFGVQAEAMQ